MMKNFEADILKGLSANPKFISPKYFYDKEGSRIFSQITTLREYYPTRIEYEILNDSRNEILNHILKHNKSFNLIEFGAGDGLKTRVMIRHFLDNGIDFTYIPIDINEDENVTLCKELTTLFNNLSVQSLTSDFTDSLELLKHLGDNGKLILFLGSTIGNLTHEEANQFLRSVHNTMNSNDFLLTGFDLRKHPKLIANAYNDEYGFTRDLNMNLLKRINRELDADFDLNNFEHYPVYDPVTGEAKSYLISNAYQKVTIHKLKEEFEFKEGEVIFTEVSRKFEIQGINELAKECGFEVVQNFTDEKKYFVDALWRK